MPPDIPRGALAKIVESKPKRYFEMWILREKTVIGAFAFAMIILGALSFMSYRTMDGLLDAEESIVHTHEVIESLDDLLNDVTRAESAVRGFIASGDQTYLTEYSFVRGEIDPEIQTVRKLT